MAAMTFSALIIYAFDLLADLRSRRRRARSLVDAFVPAGLGADTGPRRKERARAAARRNWVFDHGGNIAIALVAGGVGHLFSRTGGLLLVLLSALTSAAV